MKPHTTCECRDPGCLSCDGHCANEATVTLYRVDMDDETGTPMCEMCADDALDSGLFVDVDDDPNDCPECGRAWGPNYRGPCPH